MSTKSSSMENLRQENYRQLMKKVNMYLDNELSKEEERALLQEIKQNPTYYELLHKEKSFKEFLKSRLQRRQVSPTLIQSIKNKINTNQF